MYQHIMVPLDGSDLAECVLPHVEAIVGGCNVSKVTLIRVIPPLHLYGGIETRISPEDRHRLETDDMEKDYQRLKEKGVRIISKGPQTIPDTHPVFAGTKVLYIQDPEGHPLELMQMPK